MPSFSPARIVPPTLDAVAEGALASVVYATLALSGPVAVAWLGLADFVLAALVGVAVARLGPRSPRPRRLLAWFATAVAGGLGWLADPAASGAALSGRFDLALHPAGWVLGLAVLRGSVHSSAASDDNEISRLLAIGVPVLALPWLIHLGEPAGSTFSSTVLVGSLVFVSGSLLAIGIARLTALGLGPGEAKGLRAWWVLALAVVGAASIVALPAAFLLGAPLESLLVALLGPIGVLAERVAGTIAVILGPAAAAVGGLLDGLGRAFQSGPPSSAAPSPSLPPGPTSPPGPSAGGPIGPVLALLAIAAFAVLAIRFRRAFSVPPAVSPPEPPREERQLVLPRVSVHPPARHLRLQLPHPHRAPETAQEAYLAAVAELGRKGVGRESSESPARHSRRLREAGVAIPALDLLAADYELATYASVSLPRAETRRALRRWQGVRAAARKLTSRTESA